MAVAPVFIADMPTLKGQLRLTGAVLPDALTMIDTATQWARIYIYRELGVDRVAAIVALTYSDNPTTADGITRNKANAVELALVKIYLLRSMPTLFMDASASKQQAWNTEGFLRGTSPSDTQNEIARLQNDIDLWLQELTADDGVTQGYASGGAITVCQPCDSPIRVGRSLQGGFNHWQDQFQTYVVPPGVQGGTF